MTTIRRCPVCRQTVSSEDCTHCPECSAALEPERPVTDRALHDILENVKQQIDPLDDAGDEPGQIDRDIAAILSGSDFQALLDESHREADDVSEALSGKPAAGRTADPPDGSALSPAEPERPSPFGTALGSLKHKHEAPAAEGPCAGESQGGSEVWDGYSFLLGDGPDPDGAQANAESAAPKPNRWWRVTRQSLYLLLLLLVCLVLFRLFAPRKKEYAVEDFFRPGNPDIEFLDAINYLEKYYEQHPELKRGPVVQQELEKPAESALMPPRPQAAPESGEPGSTTDAAAADHAPASAEPAP